MKDLNRSISSPITIPYCNLVSTIIAMSVYVNIYFGQDSAIRDQKFITKRGKSGKHEKCLLDADYADFSDIRETGLVGSLEKMGTREEQK
jgi:hypothetical protein